MYCDDCGTKLWSGVCPNCHEETAILESSYDLDVSFSDDFMLKVDEQSNKVGENRKKIQQAIEKAEVI